MRSPTRADVLVLFVIVTKLVETDSEFPIAGCRRLTLPVTATTIFALNVP